jgi:hypothetical protein
MDAKQFDPEAKSVSDWEWIKQKYLQTPDYLLDKAQLGAAEGLTSPAMIADIPHMISNQTLEMPYFEEYSTGLAKQLGWDDRQTPLDLSDPAAKRLRNAGFATQLGTGSLGPISGATGLYKGASKAKQSISNMGYGNPLPDESRRSFLKGMGYTAGAGAVGIGALKAAKHISDIPSVRAGVQTAKKAGMSLSDARHKWWDADPERTRFISSKMQNLIENISFMDDLPKNIQKSTSELDRLIDLSEDLYKKVNKSASRLQRMQKETPEYAAAAERQAKLWKKYQDTGPKMKDLDAKILRDMPEDVFQMEIKELSDAIGRLRSEKLGTLPTKDTVASWGPVTRSKDKIDRYIREHEQNIEIMRGFQKQRDEFAKGLMQ